MFAYIGRASTGDLRCNEPQDGDRDFPHFRIFNLFTIMCSDPYRGSDFMRLCPQGAVGKVGVSFFFLYSTRSRDVEKVPDGKGRRSDR